MDKIKIVDLELFCNHGVFPEENVLGQKFLVSADLFLDTRAAGKKDDLEKSIHYGEVCLHIKRFLEGNTYKLIETAAEQLAADLLRTFSLMKGIRLEIKKPWAPVRLPLDTVSVEITREWQRAYIALGSNMGCKEDYIGEAVKELQEHPDCRVVSVSELITTKPYGGVEQDDFLNGCLLMETLLTPEELLDYLHQLEEKANRVRTLRWGPRTLDLDIIFYEDMILESSELTVPHVDMQNRRFVLEPLKEIAPGKVHPVLKKTVYQLAAELEDQENSQK